MKTELIRIDPFIRFAQRLVFTETLMKEAQVTDCHLIYIIEGEGRFQAEDLAWTIAPHTLFYFPAGTVYSSALSCGTNLIAVNFDLTQEHADVAHVIPRHLISEKEAIEVFRADLAGDSRLDRTFVMNGSSQVQSQLEEICRAFQEGTPLSAAIACSLLKVLLLCFHQKTEPIHPAVSAAEEYIRTHYMRELRNREIAELVGYDEHHLNRLFQKHLGKSMHQYLFEMRLNQVRTQILNTNLPLSVIAEQNGFASYPHLSDVFKRQFGVSPREYRNRFQNNA